MPATCQTRAEIDRSADADIELKWLPPPMRHLMSVVPYPVHQPLIGVWIAWLRPPSPRIHVEPGKSRPDLVSLWKSCDDGRGRHNLDIKTKVAPLVHQLGKYFDRADEMEKEFLDELLT
jgi:hypothetical protein